MAPSQNSKKQAPVQPLAPHRIAQGVSTLAQIDAERQARRESVSAVRLDDSDDEIDSPSPIYHSFLHEDSSNVATLTNFAPIEFERLWSTVRRHISTSWNVGRGNKCAHGPKDVLFMFLAVLKHCGKWDVVASVFNIKAGTFQKMILSFTEAIAPYLYDKLVAAVADKFTMETLVLSGNAFKYHPFARYATDVTFQQTNMPTGLMQERSAYYSAKHHLHGYKVEVSVLPNGLAINCTQHYAGREADIEIFRRNHSFHLQHLLKSDSEKHLADDGPMAEEHQGMWAVLADKGYQGLAVDFRAVTPHKKRPLQALSVEQTEANDRLAHDRVVVENFFGRMSSLWAVCSDKYRWSESNYDMFFKACVALTNFHVRILPLRQDDAAKYQNYLKRLRVIGHESHMNRVAVQRRYREKRRLRLRSLLASHCERPDGVSTRLRLASPDDSGEESEDFMAQESFAFD